MDPADGDSTNSHWLLCQNRYPRAEIVFFAQVIIVYILVITALVNITLNQGDTQYWLATVSGAVGYLLPNPTLKK